MYCVKCGVELAASEKKCPLCDTRVYFPGLDENPETPYPRFVPEKERFNPKGAMFIITIAFLIGAIVSFVCDLNTDEALGWSVYVLGGLVLSYTVFVLPGWFSRYHVAVFLPCDFAAVALFLGFINLLTEGDWFFTFALPVTAGAALITCSAGILYRYLRKAALYILGGAMLASAPYFLLIEWLLFKTFNIGSLFIWSMYPAITFFLVGLMLIIIAIVPQFRESLRRIFYV